VAQCRKEEKEKKETHRSPLSKPRKMKKKIKARFELARKGKKRGGGKETASSALAQKKKKKKKKPKEHGHCSPDAEKGKRWRKKKRGKKASYFSYLKKTFFLFPFDV